MKLIVQIPCFNEEKTLSLVLKSIPKKIPGITKIETLIIDDGSTDKTVAIAKKLGVNHIVKHRTNRGLAISFSDGIHRSLELGADIIVNTDGDNQYAQADIPLLIKPIKEGRADIVVGDRQTSTITEFSKAKKGLQRLGSFLVRLASGTNIPDAPSGFRAYSRNGAMSLNVITTFSYTAETIIQAGKKKIAVTYVKIHTNDKTRDSRLFKSMFEHIRKTTSTILRSYTMYEPFRVFLMGGIFVFSLGLLPFLRFIFLMILYQETIGGHLQSLIFGAVFIIFGFLLITIGVLADLIGINRKLLEDSLYRLKKIEYDKLNKKRIRKAILPLQFSKRSYSIDTKEQSYPRSFQ
ncbi:glycosyltransferase family 2 protein [Candidatus Daviesbacteria bacterium]|nr:glycosyltransferase family 2 protein [Candidatus Daviesbacteria bacterium]